MQTELTNLFSCHDLLGSIFQEEIFKCPSCKEYYDLELRVPKVLTCQHNLCLQCLKNSLLLQPLQEPQCPSCKASFSSATVTLEAFPTNLGVLAILQSKQKEKIVYCQEHDRKKDLFCFTDQVPICRLCEEYGNHKGHHIQAIKVLQKKTNNKKKQLKELLQDNVQKKQEAEKKVGEKLNKMQELVANQFFEMRKVLHLKQAEISQSIDVAIKTESEVLTNAFSLNKIILEGKIAEMSQGEYDFITTEEPDNYENYFPFVEINKKLEEILTETQGTLNKFLKTVDSLKLGPTQINEVSTQTIEEMPKTLQHEASSQTVPVQEIPEISQQIPQHKKMLRSFSKGSQEPIILKKQASSQSEILHNKDNEVFSPQAVPDEMEEEFEEKDSQKNQLIEKEMEEVKNQIIMEIEAEPQLKLDFSNIEISDEVLTTLCSEEFLNRPEKNKISHLEVNFSASSLEDQQFTKFAQTVLTNLGNLTSIIINFAESRISSESLQVLSQCLRSYKLKSFVINCSGTSIGYYDIKSLEDGLSWSIQTLENIEIILDFTCIKGEQLLDALFGMERLKSLKLSFGNSRISSEIMSSVGFCLRFLAQNLESFDLNLNGTEIDDVDLEVFLNYAILDLEKLKHFKLGLGGILVSHDLLLNFFQILNRHAPRLVTFELDLHSTKLTSTGFNDFCLNGLSKMVNLENLKLDLSQTKIDNISLINMRLPVCKLKSLTLNMSKTSLSDLGLKNFKENNNLKNLETFNFHFEQTQINDETLRDFLDHLKKESRTSKDVDLRLPLKKILPKHVSNRRIPPAASEASSEYDSDAENRPVLDNKSIPEDSDKTILQVETSTKKQILLELKKAVLLECGQELDLVKLDYSNLLSLINNLEPEKYLKILRQVLTKNLSHPELIFKNLEQWKQKVRRWISSFARSDSKVNKSSSKIPTKTNSNDPSEKIFSAHWLQKYGPQISFKEEAIEILKSMQIRSFPIFEKRLLKFVQELSNSKYKNWKMPSTNQTHWWYNFMYREKEVADAWKSLPREHIKKEDH